MKTGKLIENICSIIKPRSVHHVILPFIVSRRPKYGRDDDARWEGPDGKAYVYADPRCPRMTFGKPSHLMEEILTEFSNIAFRRKGTQLHTTCISISIIPGLRS